MRAPQNGNHDYTSCALGRDRKQDRFGTIGGAKIPFEARGGEEAQGGSSTEVGPGVRIRFPPGESPLRTWTADDSGVLGQCRWETEPSAVSPGVDHDDIRKSGFEMASLHPGRAV